jgi:hypothetical protein
MLYYIFVWLLRLLLLFSIASATSATSAGASAKLSACFCVCFPCGNFFLGKYKEEKRKKDQSNHLTSLQETLKQY